MSSTATPDATQLVASIQEAAAAVRSQEAEQKAIPSQLQAAARAGDEEALIRLRRRQEKLPARIFAARARLLSARRAHLQAELDSYQASLPALRAAVQETRDAYDRAHTAWEEASSDETHARLASSDLRQQIAALTQQLESLVSDVGQDRGPVVHSGWQAGS